MGGGVGNFFFEPHFHLAIFHFFPGSNSSIFTVSSSTVWIAGSIVFNILRSPSITKEKLTDINSLDPLTIF